MKTLFDLTPYQTPQPAPQSCEHPKSHRFENANLFSRGSWDEVCGICHATIRTYQTQGECDAR